MGTVIPFGPPGEPDEPEWEGGAAGLLEHLARQIRAGELDPSLVFVGLIVPGEEPNTSKYTSYFEGDSTLELLGALQVFMRAI